MHELGLRRIREAGVELHHAKGVYYDWIRTLEAARTFTARRTSSSIVSVVRIFAI